jgi:hypothetical protein
MNEDWINILVEVEKKLFYKGKKNVGRPRKRWTADVGTGDSPIP